MPAKRVKKAAADTEPSDLLDTRQLLRVLTAAKKGDFTIRMPVGKTGTTGKIADVVNEIIELNFRMAKEFDRIGKAVGKESRIAAKMKTEAPLKQQEELTESNQRLEQQATSLQKSEELLKRQQDELSRTNEELQEKARLLSEQKTEVERKNGEVEQARRALEDKAKQLSLTSKYKSEFLANMSHELRTPLNSLLILSQTLSDNTDGNLSNRQVDFAKTIHASGADLLELINDILDLSKIESGTMAVDIGGQRFGDLREFVERTFRQVAEKKNVHFEIELGASLANEIETDTKRLQQVLKNLLSNAFKFTESGQVRLDVRKADGGWHPDHPVLKSAHSVVAFTVTDTGIGIPKDKHQIIFEAFQQADGTTSRKYGGTGLGLSISREIARLLGGEIRLQSEVGGGSTFTLYLPLHYVAPRALKDAIVVSSLAALPARSLALPLGSLETAVLELADDRADIGVNDRVIVAVTQAPDLARLLREAAQGLGYKLLVCCYGEAALETIRHRKLDAVVVDLSMPEMAGWVVLDRLKHASDTRAVPVYAISGEASRGRSLARGAIGHQQTLTDVDSATRALSEIQAFVDRSTRSLLVVEDDDTHRKTLVELLSSDGVEIMAVGSAQEALKAMRAQRFDCVVLDLNLPDARGLELTRLIREEGRAAGVPLIVYTGRELTRAEEAELKQVAEAIVIKDARSSERLLEATSLYLHRARSALPENKRKMLDKAREKDPLLLGRKVLVIDDDVRNIFALNTALERFGLNVVFAESAKDGMNLLDLQGDIELVLMDVMMPEMDGYEAMRRLRANPRYAQLPILALTAKAMRGDREKCIIAGASDYITKPVDIEKLMSLIRVWLHAASTAKALNAIEGQPAPRHHGAPRDD